MAMWKPVPIDDETVFANIDGLVGIEVLDPSATNIFKGKKKPKKKKCDEKVKEKVVKKCLDKVVKAKKATTTIQSQEPRQCDDEDTVREKMIHWRRHGLRIEILKALFDKGFFKPTQIQESCIHGAISSKQSDIVGAAETGSGKTFAFGIPIVQEIIYSKENNINGSTDNKNSDLVAVVMTPTRELAVQVKEHLIQLCKYTDIRVALVVGGFSKEKQERLLKKCPDIVVGTPGRIWDLVNEGNPHLKHIDNIRMLVIDEADRMLERKHFEELGSLLETMNMDPVACERRRNFVFSATLTVVHDPPSYHTVKKRKNPKEKLKELFKKIGVKKQLVFDLSAEKLTPQSLSEWKIQCQFSEKDYYIVYFLQQNRERCIVFCNSIGCVRRLSNLLTIMQFKVLPLHANMEQKQRLRNLEKFRDSQNGILLATDVAARGLDIPEVAHVVHYQVPRTAESYIHRSGRTARGTKTGASLLLVSVEENKLYRNLMKTLKRDTGVDDLDVVLDDLNHVKKIVHFARDIDQARLALKKSSANEKWYEKAITEMDLIVDEDELPHKTSDRALKKLKAELSMKEKELQRLMENPILPKGFSGKFPDLNSGMPSKKKIKLG